MSIKLIPAGLLKKIERERTIALPLPGIYHYLREDQHGKARVHLRIEADGHGTLLVNASRLFYFNPTAVMMAYLALENVENDQALKSIKHAFNVEKTQARQDYDNFLTQFSSLIFPGEVCPIHDLELDTLAPFSTVPSAPYRMDLAVTYRCNNLCSHCYNERSRKLPELTTAEWLNILDRLWELGIPHVVFTGGEPTLRRDLPELVAHAEKNGQITGINTNGRMLKDKSFLNELVSAGLDHAQFTVESHLPAIHDRMVSAQGAWKDTIEGLKNALDTPLYIMTNTTLLQDNCSSLDGTLTLLAELGVKTIGLNALIYSGQGVKVGTGLPEAELPDLLEIARKMTVLNNQRLIWYTPTQYCHFDPVQMELGVKGCTAALYNMCIEPDGSVIPCQSYYHSLGNILQTPWAQIWNHDLALNLRERRNLPEACHFCAYVQECGGGCPLARISQPDLIPVPVQSVFHP